MGMVCNAGLANVVHADKALLWAVPDEWSFEEAATIPLAYGTVYYAMVRLLCLKSNPNPYKINRIVI